MSRFQDKKRMRWLVDKMKVEEFTQLMLVTVLGMVMTGLIGTFPFGSDVQALVLGYHVLMAILVCWFVVRRPSRMDRWVVSIGIGQLLLMVILFFYSLDVFKPITYEAISFLLCIPFVLATIALSSTRRGSPHDKLVAVCSLAVFLGFCPILLDIILSPIPDIYYDKGVEDVSESKNITACALAFEQDSLGLLYLLFLAVIVVVKVSILCSCFCCCSLCCVRLAEHEKPLTWLRWDYLSNMAAVGITVLPLFVRSCQGFFTPMSYSGIVLFVTLSHVQLYATFKVDSFNAYLDSSAKFLSDTAASSRAVQQDHPCQTNIQDTPCTVTVL